MINHRQQWGSSQKRVFALIVAVLISAFAGGQSSAADTLTLDGTEFGSSAKLSGVYFSNFESSLFVECTDRADCAGWTSKEQKRLLCQPVACRDLEKRIQALNGSHNRWGLFRIEFAGRQSTKREPKRFLGDTENKVLLERILHFGLIERKMTPG